MHGFGAALPGNSDQLVDGKVGIGDATVAQRPGLVSVLHVESVAVGLGIDRDRCDTQAL